MLSVRQDCRICLTFSGTKGVSEGCLKGCTILRAKSRVTQDSQAHEVCCVVHVTSPRCRDVLVGCLQTRILDCCAGCLQCCSTTRSATPAQRQN